MKRFLAFVLLIALCQGASYPWQTGWKRYKNERWGFCAAYPSNWEHYEGVNGSGIVVYPPQARPSGLLSQISVGALPAARSGGHQPTLEKSLADADETLREQGASELAVQEERAAIVNGHPAFLRKITYKEAVSGVTWIEETIAFRTPDNVDYYFELKCRPSELTELEPIFNTIVLNTFRTDCHNGHTRSAKK